jgi:hypothetical protein
MVEAGTSFSEMYGDSDSGHSAASSVQTNHLSHERLVYSDHTSISYLPSVSSTHEFMSSTPTPYFAQNRPTAPSSLIPVTSNSNTGKGRLAWLTTEYLKGDVDPAQSTAPLAAYCFMTGFMYVKHQSTHRFSFSKAFVVAMPYRSLQSSFGVAFRRETSFRCDYHACEG